MIVDSNVARKVPAISTSEDSHEMQPSSSDYPTIEVTSHAAVMDDESRDMGETQCDQQLEKSSAVRDRDDATPTSKKKVTLEHSATSQRSGEKKNPLDHRETYETRELLTVKEEDDDRLNTTTRAIQEDDLPLEPPGTSKEGEKHAKYTVNDGSRPLLPSPSASFDQAMDPQPSSHSFNHKDSSSANDRPYRPRHRRSPATTVRLSALTPYMLHCM
jgi:hypothetical protein